MKFILDAERSIVDIFCQLQEVWNNPGEANYGGDLVMLEAIDGFVE